MKSKTPDKQTLPPDELVSLCRSAAINDVNGTFGLLSEKINVAVALVNEILTPLYELADEVDAHILCLTGELDFPGEEDGIYLDGLRKLTEEERAAKMVEDWRGIESHLKGINRHIIKALGGLTDRYDLAEDKEWPPIRNGTG